jgi:hypothetical protein
MFVTDFTVNRWYKPFPNGWFMTLLLFSDTPIWIDPLSTLAQQRPRPSLHPLPKPQGRNGRFDRSPTAGLKVSRIFTAKKQHKNGDLTNKSGG